MTKIPEFIDTYSDDLLYLIDLRDSHLTHPGKNIYQPLFHASLARIFCAFMVGSIEAMIENWKDKDNNNILAPYFAQSSNVDRINALIINFKTNEIEIDENILKQYLAIKYVRNTIIHSNWNENQKEFITRMGFPTDTRNLNENHLQIMYSVNIEMMKYIASIEHKEFSQFKFNNKLPDYKRYFTKKQLLGFLWNNLERIDSEIYNGNEITDAIIEEAIFDWNIFKNIALSNRINFDKLDEYTLTLQKVISDKKYSVIPIGFLNLEKIKLDSEESSKILENLEKILTLSKSEIIPFIEAFIEGEKSYNIMINISISSLLKKLSIVKPTINGTQISKEAELAEKIFNLGQLYYNYAEKR